MTATCTHLVGADPAPTPHPIAGCKECLELGTSWVQLRLCLACGHVGCCDNSPGKHATGHFGELGHPLIRSYEPGEDWWWCFVDEVALEVSGAPASPSHP